MSDNSEDICTSAYNFANGGVLRLEMVRNLEDGVAEVHEALGLLDVLVLVAAELVLVQCG